LRLNNKLPRLIGHRGVKDLEPENTLKSISAAFELGLECVEVDVKISKDKIPLLLHDDTLERTTTGFGLVSNFTFEEINQLDAGYFFYKYKTNIKVPKLSEVLEFVKKKQKHINIELKPNKGLEILNVEKILEEVKKKSYQKIYFSSFDLQSCISLKEKAPHSLCGFLKDDFDNININDTIDLCKKYNLFSCGINHKLFSKSLIDKFKKNNIQVTLYSDKNISADVAKNLWEKNVSSIFVDDPSSYFKES
jgi:glycerophosphoryl diester phosphodiesterase